MRILVTGRHIDLTPALRAYAEEKISKFDRYLPNITEARITVTLEKNIHKVEVLLNANGFIIPAEGATGEVYSAIDQVVEKLDQQVKKYKGKLTHHRKGEGRPTPPGSTAPADEGGRIIKTKRFDLKPMTPEEASLHMELMEKNFFIFNNAISGDINVIYKRTDGNYGLIEPLR
jgi:putative sigma-54 modulation protein